MTLEQQLTGRLVDFDLYEESELPFNDPDSLMGPVVSTKLIEASMDDDVQTDDEQEFAA